MKKVSLHAIYRVVLASRMYRLVEDERSLALTSCARCQRRAFVFARRMSTFSLWLSRDDSDCKQRSYSDTLTCVQRASARTRTRPSDAAREAERGAQSTL